MSRVRDRFAMVRASHDSREIHVHPRAGGVDSGIAMSALNYRDGEPT
jgi:hypothetical protein